MALEGSNLIVTQVVVNGQTGAVEGLDGNLSDDVGKQLFGKDVRNDSINSSHYVFDEFACLHRNSADF